MKIFEYRYSNGEKAWISANTNVHAFIVLCRATSVDLCDAEDDDEIIELPQEKWTEYFVKDEYGKVVMDFQEWMNKHTDVREGDKFDVIAITSK